MYIEFLQRYYTKNILTNAIYGSIPKEPNFQTGSVLIVKCCTNWNSICVLLDGQECALSFCKDVIQRIS